MLRAIHPKFSPLPQPPFQITKPTSKSKPSLKKLQSVAINALDNNAINNTTYNLNNLHNALNFQAYESTIEQYNNALKQISWITFTEPKNLLKNTSNNYQIGTVTNAQGQNISAYDCMALPEAFLAMLLAGFHAQRQAPRITQAVLTIL